MQTFIPPKYFRIEEFVSRSIFNQFRGREHILWWQFDPRILYSAYQLRIIFDQGITINNWLWNGNRQFSGLRLPGDDHFSQTSQHSHGRGLDLVFRRTHPEEVRQFIIKNPLDDRLKYITCIEKDTPTWLHIDCRNHDKTKSGVLQVPWR